MENSIIKVILFLFLFTVTILPQQDTTQNTTSDSISIQSKSPLKAVLMSAVIPGLGQIYNESYWKVPVVWGFIGYFAHFWKINNDEYWMFARRHVATGGYQVERDFYRDQRDLFAIYIGITYILNLLDAYVDAHLFDFNVDEDMITRTPRLKMQFNFNSIFP